MRALVHVLCLMWLFSCSDGESDLTLDKEVIQPNNDVIRFLKNSGYKYSVYSSDIPQDVMNHLSEIQGEPFKIGDCSSVDRISFSDMRVLKGEEDTYEYSKMLHFVLVTDTACLLAYTEGGVGTHHVVDYVTYRGRYTHTRYLTLKDVSDTGKLREYLQSNPTPEQ